MATSKPPTSYRLSEQATECIARLAEHLGVSKTDVVEMAVRQLARKELGERLPGPAPKRPRRRPRKEK
jgi:hypothetical protein